MNVLLPRMNVLWLQTIPLSWGCTFGKEFSVNLLCDLNSKPQRGFRKGEAASESQLSVRGFKV